MPKRDTWHGVLQVLKFAKPHWPLILCTVGCMAGYAAGEGFFVVLMRPFLNVFDEYRKQGAATGLSLQRLYKIGQLALVLSPVVAVLAFLQDYLRDRVEWTLIMDLRNAICRAIIPQSLSFFEDRRSGDLMSRITNDAMNSRTAFMQLFGKLPEHGMHLLVGIGIATYMSWKLLLLGCLVAPVVFLPLGYIARRIRRYGRQGLEKLADMTDVMAQMFSGIRVIKAFRMEDAEVQEFARVNRKFRGRMMKLAVARAMSAATVQGIVRVIIALAMLGVAWTIGREQFTIDLGKLAVFFGGVYFAFYALRKLVKAYNLLQECIPAADRVFELIEHVPEVQDAPDAVALGRIGRGIAFRGVSFGYKEEMVLRDVSVEIAKGETVALIGRSGAGKSTLVALICRFYDVTDGAIEIDGIDVRKIRRDSLLDRIAIVSQQTFLFNRSIVENIRYGKPDATTEEVIAAAQAANIHEFVESLPNGYDTVCGEFGAKLSGGQRQRIAIARALLKNADILILDEAMVGLDADSQVQVRAALQELMKGRTTFAISHDLMTIENAARILVLKDGRLVGEGSHEDLMKSGGEYSSLYALQFGVG